jgi:prepilin-type N-terminal cleavage/methylation domain-containing protein
MKNKKAFTLVELIVVVTILWILSTIWFVAYSWYLVWVRDTNRTSQLKSISDGLELYRTKHSLPLPDDYVEVKANGEVIAYQWYAWKNVLESIEYTSEWVDPKDKSYYSYYLTKDKKYYQLMWFLEEQSETEVAWLFTRANAVDYSIRYPTVYGKKLWILTDENNTPIQEIPEIKSAWDIDLATTNSWTVYDAHINNGRSYTFSGSILNDKLYTLSKPSIYWAPKDCPEWFIAVWWDKEFNQKWFCVAKNEMSYTKEDINKYWITLNWSHSYNYDSSLHLKIVSRSWSYPIAKITQKEAIDACLSMWKWYHLVMNKEWMTIARQIEFQNRNWSWWKVWVWWVFRWNNWESPSSVLWCQYSPGVNYVLPSIVGSTDICVNKRRLELFNWAIIEDIAWNVWEQVNKADTLDWAWYDSIVNSDLWISLVDGWSNWNSSNVSAEKRLEYWPIFEYSSINWVWELYQTSWTVFFRWCWYDHFEQAWIYNIYMWWNSTFKHEHIWFRCAYIR